MIQYGAVPLALPFTEVLNRSPEEARDIKIFYFIWLRKLTLNPLWTKSKSKGSTSWPVVAVEK